MIEQTKTIKTLEKTNQKLHHENPKKKIQSLTDQVSEFKEIYIELENFLQEYERMWKDCVSTSIQCGIEVPDHADHPFPFSLLHNRIVMQYQSTLHSLGHVRQNLEEASNVSLSRLEQIENLSENIRVGKETEGELHREMEKIRGRLEEMEGRCVVSERNLRKIKNGVKTFWGLKDEVARS